MAHGSNILDWNTLTMLQEGATPPIRYYIFLKLPCSFLRGITCTFHEVDICCGGQ